MKTFVGIGGNGLKSIQGENSEPQPKPLYSPDAPHPYGDAVKALARLYRHAEDIKDAELKSRVERATRELLGGEVDCGNEEDGWGYDSGYEVSP